MNSEVVKYTNNAAGDLLSITDGKNQTTRFGFDEYGRVTNKLDQAGAEIFQYTYDALNRVSTMVDGVGTTVYTYTTGNQLLTEDGPFGSDTVIHPVRNFRIQRKRPLRSVSPICSRVSPARSFSHGAGTYINRLRIGLALQQPTGFWTNGFGYDAARRLTNVTMSAGAFSYSYGPSPASSLLSGIVLPNGAFIANTYDLLARLNGTSLKNSGGAVLDSYAYGYDFARQRISLMRADSSTFAFQYDKIGQLRCHCGP